MAAGTTASGPGGTPPGRAACEAFWAAVGAGPSIQEPGAAWNWANSQNATGAWEAAAKAAVDANPAAADADPMWEQAYMDVQKVLDKALGAEEEDGTGGGIASEVWLLAHQRDEARAEAAELRRTIRAMQDAREADLSAGEPTP